MVRQNKPNISDWINFLQNKKNHCRGIIVGAITILIALAALLATKELASASSSESAQRVASFVTVPIITLLVIFLVIS